MTTIHEYVEIMEQYYKGRKLPVYRPDLNALADFIEDQDPIKRLERELRINEIGAFQKLPEPPPAAVHCM